MKASKLITDLVKGLFAAFILLQPTSCMVMHVAHHHESFAEQSSYRDPVNGVVITDTATSLKYFYNNKTYYFSSEDCRNVFQRNPEKFVSGTHNHHSNMPIIIGGVAMGAMMIVMITFFAHGGW